ncbi:MAG: hypothetical protein K1X64_01675 [Myxococcaceae bacterium]|nr:hypothetical protein [Myxococcaceae bacterium]
MDKRLESVRARIAAHKGEKIADELLNAAISHAKLEPKPSYSAQELLLIADGLITNAGFIELVGRNLKVEALQAGAKLPDFSSTKK